MAEKKRQCGTCRFFVKKEASGHGKCTHPKRKGTDADLLLLRPTELACRTQWGDSLWQDLEDDRDPMTPKSPQQPTLPEPIAAQLQFDDEVTSVSIAGSKSSRSSFEDDVVDSGATASGMASWNDPVQSERLDLLRRGSQDAVAGARKRHMEKQARKRDLVPFAEDNEATATKEATPAPDQDVESESPIIPASERSQTFPPDDFVEEEKSAAEDETSFDDEMVDEGVAPDRHRSPRLRKLLREPNDPKRNEAMRVSMPSEMRVTSNNPDQRGQWNSVPTVNPNFELPLNNAPEKPKSSPVKVAASAAPIATSSYQPRPVSQARELLSEDRLRHERAQRQMVAPLVDEEAQHSQPLKKAAITDRPRLTEAPAENTAQLDSIKSSLLRGYHPANRKLNQAEQEHTTPRQQPVRPEAHRLRHQQQVRPTEAQRPYNASPKPPAQTRPLQRRSSEQQSRPVERPVRQTEPAYQEEPAPQRQPQPTARRVEERRPYIPLHQAGTPFVREEIEISPDVPRCCGTCTSFQPSEVAGRGSCTNRFAGPVQRVVYEQDLACEHTFGSFWLPADEEVWLEELDTNFPPTPRVDAMLARRRRRENPMLPDLEELTS